jgi:hypothetical protein
MKKTVNKKILSVLLIVLFVASSSLVLKVQGFDSWMAVYASEGCQSITLTDNTNSSYTDTFSSFPDMFEYDLGNSITFSGTSQNGYDFAYWRIDDGETWYDVTENPFTVTVDFSGVDLIAVFIPEHSISVSIDSPSGIYNEYPTLSISSVPVGCNLDTILCDLSWYGIPPSSGSSRDDFVYSEPELLELGNGQWTLNVTAYSDLGDTATDSSSFTVNIPPPASYTITPYYDVGCTINPSTPQTVAEGGSKTFTWAPLEGYVTSRVEVDNVPVLDTGSYTFTNVQTNHKINVTSVPKIRYNNIAVSDTIANKSVVFSAYATSGAYNLSSGILEINNNGSAINYTTPLTGLADWANFTLTLNDTIGLEIPYKFYFSDDAGNWNSTATQSLVTTGYSISASNDPYSLLSPNGTIIVCYGASVQFDFSPLDGYAIQSVIINGSYAASTTSPYIFPNVQANQEISVSTSNLIYYATVSSDGGCSITPTGLIMIPSGTWVNFTCQANPGFTLFSLLVNGVDVGVSTQYYFMPTGNATIYLTSAPIESPPEPTTSPTGATGLSMVVLEPSPEPSAEPTSIVSPISVVASPNNSPIIVVVLSVLSFLSLIGTYIVYKKKH